MGKIKKDSLGDRQKQYELVQEHYLVPKMTFIVRVDGKAFHTYTRGFKKPFDSLMGDTMLEVTKHLCEDIPGAVFGYTQSDEITIVCRYTDRIVSQAWYGGRVEKIIAITASKATRYFNKIFTEKTMEFSMKCKKESAEVCKAIGKYGKDSTEVKELQSKMDLDNEKLCKTYIRKMGNAEFDSRVFNVPEWDCINNVIWRQQDATRNSVEMVGHVHFSAKQLNKVNVDNLKYKLLTEKGIDWETDFNTYQKFGACCFKVKELKETRGKTVERTRWHIDKVENKVIQDNRDWFSEVTGLIED